MSEKRQLATDGVEDDPEGYSFWMIERLTRARQDYLGTPGLFASAHGTAALSGVAYFSMEFGR
jgi:hypothetical protein